MKYKRFNLKALYYLIDIFELIEENCSISLFDIDPIHKFVICKLRTHYKNIERL